MAASQPWLTLIRHTAVADQYKNVCYGATDVELSEDGKAHAKQVADAVAVTATNTTHVFHSGLTRARILAETIARQLSIEPTLDPRLAELNFGTWELKTWDQIFDDVGHDMSRLLNEPETYAPPSGETAHAVRDRVFQWFNDLPTDGAIIAVSHAGPIGALRGTLADKPAKLWPKLIPAFGEPTHFNPRN